MASEFLKESDKSRGRSKRDRFSFDRKQAYAILDSSLVCHVSFCFDGEPYSIPMGYARVGDQLILHGSRKGRLFQHLAGGCSVCIAVTRLHGIVLARSAFHHSMNYSSLVLFGKAEEVTDFSQKEALSREFVEFILPGRWAEVRWPNEQELKATMFLSFPIDEGSIKARSGPPSDDKSDMNLECWAGVVELEERVKSFSVDKECNLTTTPQYISNFGNRFLCSF